MPQQEAAFKWKFHRIGGLDQVTLRTGEELGHLRQLDPKLWVALSSPAQGLEFDQRTLELLDADNDGRIRMPEVVEAVEWTCARLNDPAALVDPPEALPLSAIKGDTDEGRRLLLSARAVLESLGKQEESELSPQDVVGAAAEAAQSLFNGDGILPAHDSLEDDVRQFILDALAVVGGLEDASGQPGINEDLARHFLNSLTQWRAWKLKICDAASLLGDDAPEAGELTLKLADKIDDYFLRCDLLSFAPQSVDSFNTDEALSQALGQGLLNMEDLRSLPLAHIEADSPLKLSRGLNPAWRGDLERFFQLSSPLRGQGDELSREDWQRIQRNFSNYAGALAAKPSPEVMEVPYAPTMTIEELGSERVEQILDGEAARKFNDLLAKDEAAPGAATEVAALERLVLYHAHLYRFLMNFTSFYDFYSSRKAAFQNGSLYLDGRECRLCLPVEDVDLHSTLAAFSQLCLVYCRCRRRKKSGPDLPEESINIVAAMTSGNSDFLMEGRNGVYVDSEGRDWDATVVKLIANPIDLRQAVWEPYKKVGRLVSQQINKMAGSKKDSFMAAATQKVSGAAEAAPAPFDIGKSVGIFAAIGLALGAIGTAVASIARAFFALSWYEIPLVFVGLFLIISGPSVVLTWFKLRKRTVGPLLEASGWAINGRVPVNLSLGHKLTDSAALPDNAIRSLNDPLKPASRWPWVVFIILALALGSLLGWFWIGAEAPAPAPAEAPASAPAEEPVSAPAEAPAPAPAEAPASAPAKEPAPAPAEEPAEPRPEAVGD